MTSATQLSKEELETVRLANRWLKVWRYGKWFQALLGGAFIGFAFWLIHVGHGRGAWEGIPHFVFAALGAPLLADAFFSRRSREQKLLLKLYETHRG